MSITGSEQWMYSSGREFYDFPIEQSLRFNDNDSAYLSWTPSSTGNRKTWTWSAWVKRSNIGTRQTLFSTGLSGTAYHYWYFETDDTLRYAVHTGGSRYTSAVFRDTSAWMNIIIVHDTTDSTASDRIKIYVNGDRVTSFTQAIDPALNSDGVINSTTYPYNVGRSAFHNSNYYDGYMADINFIDGQALEPTSFGEFKSGIWTPVDTSGLTFGTNGFRLQFGDTTEASGFNTVTYTGNGGAQSISGTGFSSAPDLVWIKNRSSATEHVLHDSVRGAANLLQSNSTAAELNRPTYLTSFDSDGFSFGDNVSNYNTSGSNYVAWTWDAGSGSAASNTDGSITSTVKANTDYGFSIVSYTGTGANATVGHGLTSAPDMIIAKRRNTTGSWGVYHSGMTSATYQMWLNLTNGETSRPAQWNSTAPTSSVFSVGTDTDVNANGSDYIAYCFAEKTGYSSIGSYTGTGAAGNSINLGFKPAFLLIKETGNANSWELFDNTRNTSSPFDKRLFPNDSAAEATTTSLSYSDTGFETLNGNTGINRSGGSYIYMAFADTRNAAFWRDTSGQGNDWQPNNLVFSDVVPDGTNNFATMNILDDNYASPKFSYSEGNLKYTYGYTGAGFDRVFGSIAISPNDTNKYYFEFTGNVTNEQMQWGVVSTDSLAYSLADRDNGLSATANASQLRWVSYLSAPYLYRIDSSTTSEGTLLTTSNGNAANGDIYSLVYDADAGKFYAWFNGVEFTGQNYAAGTSLWATMDTSKTYMVMMYQGDGGVTTKSGNMTANFGQDSSFAGAKARQGNTDANGLGDFYYPVPDDALALCTANLPTGAIDTLNDETPEDYFNTLLWTGDGSNPRTLSGLDFAPDLIWHKSRSAASMDSHAIQDSVRGFDLNNNLYTNLNGSETAYPNRGVINSVSSTGFTFNENASDYSTADGLNQSGVSFVSWNWKANGSGVSNTDGSINSTVSVGSTSQQNWFSVVGYTGTGANATVGHGLGVTPDMYIVKNRDQTGDWCVYHKDMNSTPEDFYMLLNLTNTPIDNATIWNDTAPTSTTFSIGSYLYGNNIDYIAYCFANAEGLCKVGKFSGNGSTTDGLFVYLGFRPAFLLYRQITAASNWGMIDNTRNPYNVSNARLFPSNSSAENTAETVVDLLSNGFKARDAYGGWNFSGQDYIYIAIAEQPFKYANAR